MSWKANKGQVDARRERIEADWEAIRKDLDALRAEITVTNTELGRTRDAWPAPQEVMDAGDRVIDERGAAYARDHWQTILLSVMGRLDDSFGRPPSRPELPPDDEPGIFSPQRCFFAPAACKAEWRAGIRALKYEAGLPAKPRAERVAQLEADLAQMEQDEEALVDLLKREPIEHRDEVLQRRDRERRAAKVEAERQEYQQVIAEQRAAGILGTPVVLNAGPRRAESEYLTRARQSDA